MSRFNPAKQEDLERPVKKGTICAARFKVDDNWYRAKVLASVGKGDYEVQFIDFGNVEVVSGTTGDLKRLPEGLLQYAPQAKEASLAFLKVPRIGTELGDQAAKTVQDIAMDQVTDVVIADASGYALQVVLFPSKAEKAWGKSVNATLLKKGLAGIRRQGEDEEDFPAEVGEWYNVEEIARDNQTGIWQYGGAEAYDEDI